MATTTLRETPLASAHRKLSARMVDFAGWNMPVQYKSIVIEHMATRERLGIFDVSHMGEFLVTGDKAADFVQYVIANDVNRLTEPNRALYSQLCYEDGGTVDDLIVYRRKDNFMLVVNASNIEKDFAWLKSHAGKFGVTLTDLSDDTGLIALQGPQAVPLLAEIAGDFVSSLPSFGYGEATVDGVSFSFGRTGYTGEDGFEIFVPAAKVEWLWNTLLERGAGRGIEPCGLGARDTLRLEAGLPLYGHELEKDITPIESGLGWSVKPEKGDFIGREVLAKQKAGKELTKEEKAVLSVGADWVADSIRIRDRDFAKFKEQNDPRNYYKTSDRTVRYTDKEIAEMTAQEEGKLRAAAEKQAKAEAEQARQAELEKQRQAAELETQRQAELEKQRQAAELETQRQAELERQRALAAAIERNVPSDAIVGKALVQSELGKDTDAPAVRNAMKAFVTQEIAAGTLKPENLNAPYPRVGAAFVGTGAVTAQEFQAAIDQQNKLREADPNKQAPQIGAILLETFKNDPAKVAKIKKASNFYDVMKKLAEEEAAAQAAKK